MAGVVVIFDCLNFVGEAAGNLHFYFIFRFVFAVAAGSFSLPELGSGKNRFGSGDFFNVVAYSVFVSVFISFESAGDFLIAENKDYSGVYYRLALDNFLIPFNRNSDIGENIVIGFPADFGTGFAFCGFFLMKSADVFALFKMEFINKAVAADFRIHPFGGILGCAKAKSVKAKGKFIIACAFIFSARIKFAEKKFPVIALFVVVPIDRASAAEVFDLGGTVVISGDDYFFAVTGSCFVYGV